MKQVILKKVIYTINVTLAYCLNYLFTDTYLLNYMYLK